jgi:hypothetical protein
MNLVHKIEAEFRQEGTRVWRDGFAIAIAIPGPRGRLAVQKHLCSSAPVAKHAIDLFGRIRIGDTPLQRLRAAIIYAEAAPIAARRRLRGS